MIYSVFHKEARSEKDEFEINYYLEMNRKGINVIYEYIGIYVYNYRKYTISLNCYLKNEYAIIDNLTKNFEKVYSYFAETRKLAIFAKYTAYITSKLLDIPLYKLIQSVTYEANGEVQELSTNAFIKSTYKIAQKFQVLGL